jgi:hypothetical protein
MLKRTSAGFSAIDGLIVLLVITAITAGGWYVWQKSKEKESISKPNEITREDKKAGPKSSSYKIPEGWIWFESKDMGLKFAHPKTWEVAAPRTTKTAKDELGWVTSVQAINRRNGDPGITIDTYMPDASIVEVDAGPNDSKVQDITTADGKQFSLVGTVEDPSKVSKPTQMYASTCWPRSCTPHLSNGRFLGIAVGSTNNDCSRGELCPTEINTSSENYDIFLAILRSITSL